MRWLETYKRSGIHNESRLLFCFSDYWSMCGSSSLVSNPVQRPRTVCSLSVRKQVGVACASYLIFMGLSSPLKSEM